MENLENETKEWYKNITFWNKIEQKSAEVVIAQSENLLKETILTAQSIKDRADKLIGILIPIISGLLAYIISNLPKLMDILQLCALFSLVTLISSFCVLYINTKPYKINVPGENPEFFLNDNVIYENDKSGEQFIKIALMICHNCQIRIIQNEEFNKIRGRKNKIALNFLVYGLFISPFLALTVHLLYQNYFEPVFCK